MPAFVGTSGWQYSDWRERFYPKGMAQRQWLASYAGRFPTVELNSSFYRLPERSRFEQWAAQVPEGFVFSVKASRYLTHVKRLRDPVEAVERLVGRVEGLARKAGPILLQLPPSLPADLDSLCGALDAFPRRCRLAVEWRHRSWDDEAVFAALEARDVCYCLADRAGPLLPWRRTASFGYVRFHEGRSTPRPRYGQGELRSAGERVRRLFDPDDDVYVYFNNDTGGAAPDNARSFAGIMQRAGWRVPGGLGASLPE